VLLPELNCESALEEHQDQPTCGGYLFVVDGEEIENTKVRVVRDLRNKQDLLLAFQEADPAVINEVWSRTRSFSAASTILSSLLNSNHHMAKGPLENDLGDESMWPALSGGSTGGSGGRAEPGWEVVQPPEGEEWELLDIDGITLQDTSTTTNNSDNMVISQEDTPVVDVKPKVRIVS